MRTRNVAGRVATFVLASVAGAPGCGSSSREGTTCQQSMAVRVCGSGQIVQGVDVSKYDATVDWAKAKTAGIQFGFARISDGIANPDANFVANWQAMQSNGVVRGAYQYFRASVDPTAQANLVVSSLQKAGGLYPGDLPVVLDLETADGQPEGTIEANVRTWLAAVEAQTRRTPIIYTSSGTYPVSTAAFASYPLWVANYGASCPSMPTGWSQWQFWQYSSTGSVNGIGSGNVDLDEYNGTLADLMAFAGSALVDSGMAGLAGDGGPPADAGSAESEAGAAEEAGASGNGGSAMGNAGNKVSLPDASAGSPDASTVVCR